MTTFALLLFPELTQLDLTGPYEVFCRCPDARVELLWKDRAPVRTEHGLMLAPTATLAEVGVPDTEVFAFQGILAPAGLPAAITTRLNTDLNKALLNPAVVKRMNDFGMEALPGTPEQFRAMARAESKRWGEIIKAAGVKLD